MAANANTITGGGQLREEDIRHLLATADHFQEHLSILGSLLERQSKAPDQNWAMITALIAQFAGKTLARLAIELNHLSKAGEKT